MATAIVRSAAHMGLDRVLAKAIPIMVCLNRLIRISPINDMTIKMLLLTRDY